MAGPTCTAAWRLSDHKAYALRTPKRFTECGKPAQYLHFNNASFCRSHLKAYFDHARSVELVLDRLKMWTRLDGTPIDAGDIA